MLPGSKPLLLRTEALRSRGIGDLPLGKEIEMITYKSVFKNSGVSSHPWNIEISAVSFGYEPGNVSMYPKPGAIIRVTKRDGEIRYIKLGDDLVSSPAGARLYKIASSVRMPLDLSDKNLRSKLRIHNPRRLGSFGHKSLQIIINAQSLHIDDFLYLGGRIKDLRWDLERYRVRLTDTLEDTATETGPKPVDEAGGEINEPSEAELDSIVEAPEEQEPEIERPTFETKADEYLPAVFQRIFELAKIGQNILMVGPSGSGKTFLSSVLAEKLGRKFAAQSCSAGMSESMLGGWLLPVKDAGTFAYVPSAFVRAYEEGGVFLFDEIDAADENTLIFVNAALANGVFYLAQRFENPEVKRHPDFVAIAAANTFGLGEDNVYTGRTQLDGATLDRFRAGIVVVDYDKRVEGKLVDRQILGWGRKIRAAIKKHSLNRIMSTRVLIDFTTQKRELGYSIADMAASYFADWTTDERALAETSEGAG